MPPPSSYLLSQYINSSSAFSEAIVSAAFFDLDFLSVKILDITSIISTSKINYTNNIDKNNRVTAKDFRDIIGSKLIYIPIDEDIVDFYKQNLNNGDILINMSSGGFNGNQIVKSIINSLK